MPPVVFIDVQLRESHGCRSRQIIGQSEWQMVRNYLLCYFCYFYPPIPTGIENDPSVSHFNLKELQIHSQAFFPAILDTQRWGL